MSSRDVSRVRGIAFGSICLNGFDGVSITGVHAFVNGLFLGR